MSPFDRAHTTSYSTLIETMHLSSFITPTGSNTVIYSKNIHSKKHKKAAYRNNTMYRFRDIASYLLKVANFDPPHLHLASQSQ